LTVALSRERIVDQAIALADASGFEAVTLRRLASELGVHVTSLYNHVETRDALIDAMVERLVAEAKLPSGEMHWEEWVRAYFDGLSSVASAHPGAFYALQDRPVQSVEATASFETALRAFSEAGLSLADAYGAIKATTLTALSVGVELALEQSGRGGATDIEALPEDGFALTRALGTVSDNHLAYQFIAETLVAGLRSQVRNRKGSSKSRSATRKRP
jgi:AcrR family transcriptional regulator